MRDKPLLFWWEHEHFCHHWALNLSTSLEVWAPLAHIHLCVCVSVCVLGVHICTCFYDCASLHLLSKPLMLWLSLGNQSTSLHLYLWLLPPAWCPLIVQSYVKIPGESGLAPCVQWAKSESQPSVLERLESSTQELRFPQLRFVRASLVAQLVKNLPALWEIWVWSLGGEDFLEKGKATHSSILVWRIPWTA